VKPLDLLAEIIENYGMKIISQCSEGTLMADKNSSSWVKYMAWGSTIGAALAGLVGGGYFIGNYLDSVWGTDPWLKIALMISGVILGVTYLILSLSKLGKSSDE
jgi:F0F1-type ATP synthase assembly protein I